MKSLPRFGKINTTNPLAAFLDDKTSKPISFDSLDLISSIRITLDEDRYEEKEREIPELICEILEKESRPFTKLIRRKFIEEDAWLVSVECREGEHLHDNGHQIYSSSESELLPAIIEENVSMHFVKIHVPKIFVRTVSLPMIHRAH